jgi:putative transposase
MTYSLSSQSEAVIGVDLGVSALATLSNGEVIVGPKSHAVALKRLRRANKALSRKRKGSANFRKCKRRLAKIHARVANIRRDATHKLTTRLTHTYKTIGIEPERERHGSQPLLGAFHHGWRVLRVAQATHLQD